MNLDILYKNIGKEYTKDLLGCVMPLYLLYPEIPIYKYIDDCNYYLELVNKYFNKISFNELKKGDLIILKTKQGSHFCIYNDNDLIFHCTEKSKLNIVKLSNKIKYISYCGRRIVV